MWGVMLIFNSVLACLCVLASVGYAEKIVNDNYSRRVGLYNTIVREEHHIRARVVESAPEDYKASPVFINTELVSEIYEKWFPGYIVVVEKERAANVASFAAFNTESGKPTPMMISDVTEDVEACKEGGNLCLSVDVDMRKYKEGGFDFIVMITYINTVKVSALTPNQQNSEYQQIFVIPTWSPMTPYDTKLSTVIVVAPLLSIKAKLVCPQGRIPRHLESTSPNGQHSFTCVLASELSGQATEGPTKVSIIGRNAVFLRIKKLVRKLTLLPWTKRIQISDHYELYHEGFPTDGFNRMEYIDYMGQKQDGAPITVQHVASLAAYIPSSAKTLEIRDQVGMNYKHIMREKQNDSIDMVQLPFRYPLVGGQYYEFDHHYSIAYEDFIVKSSDISSPFRYLLSMPLYLMAHDLVIDSFDLVVNLPEDAHDVEFEVQCDRPFKLAKDRYRTFFSTKGEQRLKFHFENMVKEEIGTGIDIVFTYPWWAVSRKPLIALSVIVIMTIVIMRLAHVRLSWDPVNKTNGEKMAFKQIRNQLKTLFSKRRDLMRDFEDLMGTYWRVSRLTLQDIRLDVQQRARIDDTLSMVESAIFEKLKSPTRPNSSQQQQTLLAIALKQLYSDQSTLIRSIVDMVARSKGAGLNSISDDSASLGSMSLGSIEPLVQLGEMSQSVSDGNLFNRRVSDAEFQKEIAHLAASAAMLDDQVLKQEAKFLY